MEIILRDATPQDIDTLTTTIRAAFAEYHDKLDPPSGAHAESPVQVGAKLAKGGATLALIGSEYAGCVLYYPLDGYLYLGRLAVLPSYRQHGIGLALVEAVESKAAEMGLQGVQLSVRIALPRNRAFFEKLGYRVVSYHCHPGYAEPTFVTLVKPFPTESR